MAFWDSERELLQVKKEGTKTSYYSFKRVSKGGRDFIDVREHFAKADGTIQHTAKGMAIPVEMFDNMMVGFRDVYEIIKEEGGGLNG